MMNLRRWLAAALLAIPSGGCDYPFEPFQENDEAPLSMFGVLDLYADTQWIRVMPVRTSSFLDRTPIDAVVTLQHMGNGRTVVLEDSLFAFEDIALDRVVYAHNFWTTEPLEPSATYRLKAVNAEGDSTIALVALPGEIDLSFRNDMRQLLGSSGRLFVQAEHVVSAEVLYVMQSVCGAGGAVWSQSQPRLPASGLSHTFAASGLLLYDPEGCLIDQRRQEIRVTAARADWPYDADLSDLDVARPGTATSNVVNGLGFVAGLARRIIPYHRCQMVRPRPISVSVCQYSYGKSSSTVAGRVVSQPCGKPYALQHIRLIETYPDGGVYVRHWKTGLDGEYRFEGIEPGVDLTVQVSPIDPGLEYFVAGGEAPTGIPFAERASEPSVKLPRLGAGQVYPVGEIGIPLGC